MVHRDYCLQLFSLLISFTHHAEVPIVHIEANQDHTCQNKDDLLVKKVCI